MCNVRKDTTTTGHPPPKFNSHKQLPSKPNLKSFKRMSAKIYRTLPCQNTIIFIQYKLAFMDCPSLVSCQYLPPKNVFIPLQTSYCNVNDAQSSSSPMSPQGSVTRWQQYVFYSWQIQQQKFAQKQHNKLAT